MEVAGDYAENGYAHLKGLIAPELAQALLGRLSRDLGGAARPVVGRGEVLKRPALEIPGTDYPPLAFFLWGLTPTVSRLVGCELLPTYAYFRAYRAGDVCLVHSDREACQHSLSLTLGYADGKAWPLEIGRRHVHGLRAPAAEDFGDEEFGSVAMAPGDAVLYRGLHRRHGRLTPNPNRWSAHLFLHWVARDGHYADQAFEGFARDREAKIDFG